MSPIANNLAVLALAGSALAAPSFGGHHGHRQHQHNKHFFGSSGVATGTGATGTGATGTGATGTGAPYGVANATGIWGTGASSGFVASTRLASGYAHPSAVDAEAASETTSTCTSSVVRVTHTNRVTVTVQQSEAAPATTLTSSSAAASSSAFSLDLSGLQNKAYSAKNHRKWGKSTAAAAESTTAAAAEPTSTSVAPIVSAVSSVVSVASSVVSSVVSSASAAASSAVAKSSSGKRGVAYNDASLTTCFESYEQVTWGYNWGSSSSGLSSSFNYVPLLWGTGSDHTSGWSAAAQAAIDSGSTHLMSFNEPDLDTQANLSPADAAAAFKTYMMPFAGKAKLGSPAVTNGANGMGLDWLSAFLEACDGCQIDFVPIHWYESASNTEYFKDQVTNATNVSGGKPVWVTEFGATSGDVGTFLETVMPWMDSQDFVERYSYFMVSSGILVSGTEPSAEGTTYATFTS